MKRLALVATVALAGCAQSGPKPLYQWDGYQPAVYNKQKSNGSEPRAQIPVLEAQIQKKVEGEEITVPEGTVAPAGAKVIDIMDALRASLNRKGGNGAGTRTPAAKESAARKRAKQSEGKKPSKKAKKSTGRALRKAA